MNASDRVDVLARNRAKELATMCAFIRSKKCKQGENAISLPVEEEYLVQEREIEDFSVQAV